MLGAGEVAVPPAVVPITSKPVADSDAQSAAFEVSPTIAEETESNDSASIGTSKPTKLHKDIENDVSAEDATLNNVNVDADIVGDDTEDDVDDSDFASNMPAFGGKWKQPPTMQMPVFFPMNLGKMFGNMADGGNGGGAGAIAIANSHSVDGMVFSHASAHSGSLATPQRRRGHSEKLRA